mmetsp:Transcript_27320/g.87541  ORF Transcript_27320/g.87541 Transcript_27320/m.87541 type:complete len:251 (-) Transcript_27320:56-808(-)
MHHPPLVHVLERVAHLHKVLQRLHLIELLALPLLALQDPPQVALLRQLQHNDELVLLHEAVLVLDDVRVVQGLQDLDLVDAIVAGPRVHYLKDLHFLQRHHLPSCLALGAEDRRELPVPNHPHNLEVSKRARLLPVEGRYIGREIGVRRHVHGRPFLVSGRIAQRGRLVRELRHPCCRGLSRGRRGCTSVTGPTRTASARPVDARSGPRKPSSRCVRDATSRDPGSLGWLDSASHDRDVTKRRLGQGVRS